MNIAAIHPNDIVRCDRRGRVFLAEVAGHDGRTLSIVPVTRGINYFSANSHEVKEHWRRRTGLPKAATIRPHDLVQYITTHAEHAIGEVQAAAGGRYRIKPLDPHAAVLELRTHQLLIHYARPRRRARAKTPMRGESDGR